MKKILLILVTLLVLVSMVGAGDVFNAATKFYAYPNNIPATGNIVAYWEDYSHITYMWRFTWVDSSNNPHSPPLYIGNCNVSDGYINAIQSATGDANIIHHFSADNRTTWLITTAHNMDAVSNTAKQDTIGIESAADDIGFHAARWYVIEAASGSSTNQDGNIITVVVKFKKATPTSVNSSGEYVKMARVARQSKTNP